MVPLHGNEKLELDIQSYQKTFVFKFYFFSYILLVNHSKLVTVLVSLNYL